MKTQRSFARGWQFLALSALVAAVVVAALAARPFRAEAQTQAELKAAATPSATPAAAVPKQIKIDLGAAVKVPLPAGVKDLEPAAFKTSDGKTGWVVRVPGGRPLATPAYSDGMLFVGGGYGSHEFYAFDAKTGRMVWKVNAGDDGPTAAVVEDGLVAFNTESCTLVVVDEKTGKLVWQEWLGDPLMSQPAVSKGKLYMAYPAGQRGHANVQQNAIPHVQQQQSAAAHVIAKPAQNSPQKDSEQNADEEVGSHRLLCADLKTGRHIWERAISSDVISAPVVSEDKVYFTTFDGTSYSLDAGNGKVVWKKKNAGTSAPLVVAGNVVVTQKEARDGKAYEGLRRLDTKAGTPKDEKLHASEEAKYLDKDKGGGVAINQQAQGALDSSVGFGNAPASAELGKANEHLGVKTVVGGWAYQGSRAAYSKGQMLNAQGRYLNSVGADDGRFKWRAEVSGGGLSEDAQVFSPPALGEQFLYLSSSLGHILSVGQDDGRVGFMYQFPEPMVFQPALANGSVYVGTSNGLLICLKTGSADADGWYAWGGNGEHNKNR
ncbi:MAG TPA: PQQ-binding-like beta-propeller repeat protein [Pyrinomonadaceae bacterium]|jgi:Ca-activated chloride channel family protein|nr:PQQ-binding-like beta-propeller repeat protein [Pyrinomonadaceae bacterium]